MTDDAVPEAKAGARSKKDAAMIRALRLELVKPLDESWETVGPLLRMLAKATPMLLNAALDAGIAIRVAGLDPVKSRIGPEAKARTTKGLLYQAVLRKQEDLRAWGVKNKSPWANLDVPSGTAAGIQVAAFQALSKKVTPGTSKPGQSRTDFTSERIIVPRTGTLISADSKGITISLKLRPKGAVRFAVAHSIGSHRETLAAFADKTQAHGDVKIKWDKRRKKWYALVSYKPAPPKLVEVDPARALVVHRGIRNALFLLTATGQSKPMPGSKFLGQRKAIYARMKDMQRVTSEERGAGAKGRGRLRRFESSDSLQGKLSRVTRTFCQQAAAFVGERAKAWGCGLVIIEDYGGIQPDEDRNMHRVLDRFPFHELKQCITQRLERDGVTLRETSSAFISTTCPRCEHCEPRNHNQRTGIFHCRACIFERPADWVAAFWMLANGGGDMTTWRARLQRERSLSDALRGDTKEAAE